MANKKTWKRRAKRLRWDVEAMRHELDEMAAEMEFQLQLLGAMAFKYARSHAVITQQDWDACSDIPHVWSDDYPSVHVVLERGMGDARGREA